MQLILLLLQFFLIPRLKSTLVLNATLRNCLEQNLILKVHLFEFCGDLEINASKKVETMKNSLNTKLYYNISEVSQLTGLQSYTLRAWEKEFSCLRPKRTSGKSRAYRERDISVVLLLKNLLYEQGFTSKGAKTKLKNEPNLLKNLPQLPLPGLTTATPKRTQGLPKNVKKNNNGTLQEIRLELEEILNLF